MQLSPGETFAIVRQLADPNDSATYYVQATIRNARTDALLDTKNLTDRGGQRFSVEYQVPSKSSDAVYIAISTRVYTDSGYTTLSDAYGQEIATYLVEMRQQHFGGGGSGISYQKIEEIVRAVLAEVEKPEPAVPTDLSGVIDGVKRVENAIKGVMVEVGATKGAIGQIRVNPVVNLAPILDAVGGLRGIVEESHIKAADMHKKSADDLMSGMAKMHAESSKSMEEKVRSVVASIMAPIKEWMSADSAVASMLSSVKTSVEKAFSSAGPVSPIQGKTTAEMIREIMGKP